MLAVNKTRVATDKEGYLLDPQQWDESLALQIAASENIVMTDAHWEIVHFIREYFELQQSVPENRALLKTLRGRHGEDIATRKYIHTLFPYGFGQQACKIAGMRKPLKLLLDV
jgi:TusE/DsrC/DsvC family sulfur relay protein